MWSWSEREQDMAAKESPGDLEHPANDHPVGTTVGAAGGAVAGVTAGSVIGGPGRSA